MNAGVSGKVIDQNHQDRLRELVGENNFKGANALALLDPGKNAQSLDAGVAVKRDRSAQEE